MNLRPRPFDRDVGLVMASWLALLALEYLFVGVRFREEIAGVWETGNVFAFVVPLSLAAGLPLAIGAVLLGRLAAEGRDFAVGLVAGAAGGATAIGVSTGRHFSSLALRAPFVLIVALAAFGAAVVATRRAPLDRPRLVAGAGLAIAVVAWIADRTVLPRLYPAFHLALFAIALLGWAAVVVPLRTRRAAPWIALGALVLAAGSLAWSPRAAAAIAERDNVRRVLVEHAPALGRSVLLSAWIHPPPPLDDADGAGGAMLTSARQGPGGRSLNWSGRDIVLVTIDALRADHVSTYGYARKTTPNIDRLAARGARFTHAYCPTPHTSYSVASMMAGTYMRPLLSMGAADDVETWASHLRRYDFRTAAFYPPAVFFIDAHRFEHMRDTGLGFEYRKVEFARPELRREQIARYLERAPPGRPLFLWAHLFEPHEPYVMHPEHPFSGDETADAYDSEIATADALVGQIVDLVETRRPGAIVIVSADHGEELGDHGGRYHGTTVYEEQVRVPLIVVGPGVAPSVLSMPVQTIDLLPTTLRALDIPLTARIRGRDLGGILAGEAGDDEHGLAFAETGDYTMIARDADRLVCERRVGSCSLFDVARDPEEKHPVEGRAERIADLRKLTAAVERENGRVEASGVPEALRRCLQGDADAAEEVAALLDDVRADVRRDAARCAFHLRAAAIGPQLRRAARRDEDALVRGYAEAALTRIGEDAPGAAEVLRSPDPDLRLAAALALAERGDASGEGELVARWDAAFVPGSPHPGELDEARELATAFGRIRARTAVPSLVRTLGDVRLRPYVVEALGAIGDGRAKDALAAAFAAERYLNVRAEEARALLRVGAKKEDLAAPLARFAGVPEPMAGALSIAGEAGLLRPEDGGWMAPAGSAVPAMAADLVLRGDGPARLFVRTLEGEGASPAGTVGDASTAIAAVRAAEPGVWTAEVARATGPRVHVALASAGGLRAVWLVRRAPEIPPPPPRAWDGGADGAGDEP